MIKIWESQKAKQGIETLPHSLLERWEFWRSVVRLQGPEGLKGINGFKDHSLKGKWNGFNASSLNFQWRVIYKIIKNEVIVELVSDPPYE